MSSKTFLTLTLLSLPLVTQPTWGSFNGKSCERYTREAIRQQQANEVLGAGFVPPAWKNDFYHHYYWCLGGSNALYTPIEMANRARKLQEYAIKTKQSPCQRYAREAVRQYHASEKLGTGLKPPGWSDAYHIHLHWCARGALPRTPDELANREYKLQDFAVKYNTYEGLYASFTTDFEDGTLRGWKRTGTAVLHQPTKGDNPTARLRAQPSLHEGTYWIGTYERYQGKSGELPGAVQGDGPTGTLTSPPFNLGSEVSFLIGGGSGANTRVELLVDGFVVLTAHGRNTETMHRVLWNVGDYAGRTGQIRIVDHDSGGWGHINVDDIRILPRVTETMDDDCSADVAIVSHYDATPNGLGTQILRRGEEGRAGWTRPFRVNLGKDGHVRWWCNSTTGNWADPGTWRLPNLKFDVKCLSELASGLIDAISGDFEKAAGKLCSPFENLEFGSSAVNDWTPERSRCRDRSNLIRARLGSGDRLDIQCLGE